MAWSRDSTNSFWLSVDGHSWRKTVLDVGTTPEQVLEIGDVAGGPNGVVAVGGICCDVELGAIWWSPDAEQWQRVELPLPEFEHAVMTDVAAGPAGFLAVGVDFDTAAAWFSPDGLVWHGIAEGSLPRGRLSDVVDDGERGFVAVGIAGRENRRPDAIALKVSADGGSWQTAAGDSLTGPLDDWLDRVWAFSKGYLADGVHGDPARVDRGCESYLESCPGYQRAVYRSADGRRWRRIEDSIPRYGLRLDPPRFWEFSAIAPWGDGLIAVGADSTAVVRLWHSRDGVAWKPIGDPIPIDGQFQEAIVRDLLVDGVRIHVTGITDRAEDGFVLIGTFEP